MTIQFVVATALSLLVFVLLANFVVFLYARGVVRAAIDEGVRAGARAGVVECEQRAEAVLSDLLAGMRSDVRVRCEDDGQVATSRAEVRLRGWLPPVTPTWSFTVTAESFRERTG